MPTRESAFKILVKQETEIKHKHLHSHTLVFSFFASKKKNQK